MYHQRAPGDAGFERSVNEQRVVLESQARQPDAADAKPAHKGGQQDTQRHRGGADGQLQLLVPDDFIDQRSAPAGSKEQQ